MSPVTPVKVCQATATKMAESLLLARSNLIKTSGDGTRFFEWQTGIKALVYSLYRNLFGYCRLYCAAARAIGIAVLPAHPEVNKSVYLSEAAIVWWTQEMRVLETTR